MKHLSILVPDAQTNLSTVACIVGTQQIFAEANKFKVANKEKPIFEIEKVGAVKNGILENNAVTISHETTINEIKNTQLIIIPATIIRNYEMATQNNKLLIDWITKQYKEGAEVASMCIGGFMLASTGLLNGKSCSTHWALAESFKNNFPEIKLQTDKLITDENGIYTNGGAYSFLHLLLYLVEKFYDRATAIHCSKYFQIDINRNLQAEFSIFNGYKQHNDEDILLAQKSIEENFTEKISIEHLATELNIGRRNFDRRFIKATGLAPLDYIQRVKIEAAKKLFESSRKTVSEIMYEVGYNDAKAFRDVFSRISGITPLDYKQKYNRDNNSK